jgi:hypothetical protein
LGGGCKQSDKVWGVINTNTRRLHRLTFSKSLCNLLVEKLGTDYKAIRFHYIVGKPLSSGYVSASGLYAVMSVEKNVALRISLNKDIAALYNECDSRYLAEAWLEQEVL